MRQVIFRVPVRMDDGKVRIFGAFRVIHNDARGPANGGVRFHPSGTLDLICAQAMWMTWRCALLGVPLGGAAGGVACDPHGLSAGEQERLCRGWVRANARDLGPDVDIPEPDLGTNPQHMLWMLDEYEVISRGRRPGFATGKPVGMGGSLGRREAAGYGIVIAVREALKAAGMRAEDARAAVQGFGTVGQPAVSLFQEIGGTVTCVASWSPSEGHSLCFRKKDGVILEELAGVADRFGNVDPRGAEKLGYEVLPGEAWLAQDVDVLIPAALDNQVTAENVANIGPRVRIVAEGADGAVAPAADEVLGKRGVAVIPSFLANAGGVTCSYFEQVQSSMNYFWERDEVLGKLDVQLTGTFAAVSELAKKRSWSLRDAAHVIAVSRVAEACHARGWV